MTTTRMLRPLTSAATLHGLPRPGAPADDRAEAPTAGTLGRIRDHAAGEPATIAVVGQCDLVVHGVADMLRDLDDVQVTGVEHGWRPTHPVALALVDIFADGHSGRSDLALLLASPLVRTVVCYSWGTDGATQALALGAHGYVSKHSGRQDFAASVRQILEGGAAVHEASEHSQPFVARQPSASVLTPRESDVIRMIGEGYSNIEIARLCFLSINSVKSYVRSAYRKIGVETRPQAIRWALGQDAATPALSRGVG